MGNVSVLSILAMAVSLILCIGFPVFLCVFIKKKTGGTLRSMFLGAATFVVFALVLEQIVHVLVFKAAGTLLTDNRVLYALYGGLAAGLFEETGRYVTMKFLIKDRLKKQEALMYGIGHGGIEAVFLGGAACLSNLITSVMLNAGGLNDKLAVMDETAKAGVLQLTTLPSWQFLLVGMERVSAVILQICLSYLVYLAVKTRKISWFWLAVLVHFLVDAGTLLASSVVPLILLEVILLALVILFARVLSGKYQAETEEGPASEELVS